MSEDKIIEGPGSEGPRAGEKPHPLREALNRARQQEAERSDVIVDLREAELARLELLQDALSDVFDEIPEENDLLECALIPGTPPRLWVDVLGHVVMARDKRTYRFLKDTRHGRHVILETTSLDEMASRITDYVAHRLIERERALETEQDGKTVVSLNTTGPVSAPEQQGSQQAAPQPAPKGKPFGWGVVIFAFLFGVLAGAVGLFAIGLALTAG